MDQIEIYKTKDNQTIVEVQFENDTVWLSQIQIAKIFEVQRPAITKHLANVFKSGELIENSVSSILEHTAKDNKKYKTKFYNLDAIISVGYRINSKRATQFRQWATQRLKDHLLKGYTLNEKRLQELSQNLHQLEQAVAFIRNTGNSKDIQLTEAKGLLDILSQYTHSFILLNQFDSNNLALKNLNTSITYEIKYDEAIKAIDKLKKELITKKEASVLFGNQKDKSFEGILQSIIQTFDSKYLYPSIEEQAAHLLYFVIKNHPFSDGNKRIGAFLFIWFLEKNKHRFKKSGELKINDNALTAIALLVAQSNPMDKELMIALIINLIKNQ